MITMAMNSEGVSGRRQSDLVLMADNHLPELVRKGPASSWKPHEREVPSDS